MIARGEGRVLVRRLYGLGHEGANFTARTPRGFARKVASDARAQREGGDLQGITYIVPTEADARALGAVDTVGGWLVREAGVILDVEVAS